MANKTYNDAEPWVTHCEIQLQGGDPYSVALGARERYKKPVVVEEYGYESNRLGAWPIEPRQSKFAIKRGCIPMHTRV